MIRERETGACYAYSKADGSAYRLERAEYPRLIAEWMAGRAFFAGKGLYGSEVNPKLGDIVAVIDTTADQLLAGLADRRADEEDDRQASMLHGE